MSILMSLNPAWINAYFRASISANAKGPGVVGAQSYRKFLFLAKKESVALDKSTKSIIDIYLEEALLLF